MKMDRKKLQNTETYKKLISDENIYLSVYSIESYVFNRELLNAPDRQLLEKLKDKFNGEIIGSFIKKVKERLDGLLFDSKDFVLSSVYFNPKKYGERGMEFRPLHVASLRDQAALVSMLNLFIYDMKDTVNSLTLSNLSRLIPENFYGNRVSLRPEELFVPWKEKYESYTQEANERFKNYHNTGEYKFEVDLDLENFFPSVSPAILYRYILDRLPITVTGDDLELYRIMLIKLLICRIDNLDGTMDRHYYGDMEAKLQITFSKGIPQGLPQSYFLGNICMIEIAKIYADVFKGVSLFYVDDSVIFTNEVYGQKDFADKLDKINLAIKESFEDVYNIGEAFACGYNDELAEFLQNIHFGIKVHGNDKSVFSEIAKTPAGEIHMRCLSREASKAGFDLFSSYSDEEDETLLNKITAISQAIEKELENIEKNERGTEDIEAYKKKLIRYRKFFKYRQRRLRLRNERAIINLDEICISLEDPDFLARFMEKYREDIWNAEVALFIKNEEEPSKLEKVRKYIIDVNEKLFGYSNCESSYLYKAYSDFIDSREYFQHVDVYETLKQLVAAKYSRYNLSDYERKIRYIEERVLALPWKDLLEKTGLFEKCFLDAISLVDANSDNPKRMVLNAIYSELFQVDVNDSFVLSIYGRKSLSYGELRQLILLRNDRFSKRLYEMHRLNLRERNNHQKMDYAILEVMEIFCRFVKDPELIDNLILVHQYTCDVWKNGSKYLYFYTLHNQEHAIDLIKNIVKLLKTIDYLQIGKNDYYILFLSCYLHDISMVRIPAVDRFLLNSGGADKIALEHLDGLKKMEGDFSAIKKLLCELNRKMDAFYEAEVRGNHAKDSASEIRNRKELLFLDDCLREVVAEVAEAHGQQIEDVYHARSEAMNTKFSLKYDKILLRMADLLDMSSYRISKPILSHNIEQMTPLSAFHWISHLITDGYRLITKYDLVDKENPLSPEGIEEKIELHIDVAMSQLSRVEKENCTAISMSDYSNTDGGGLVLRCGEKCNQEECNFLCKWFVTKNEYLVLELEALQTYLNSLDNNYFKTSIKILLHITDKTYLEAKEFEILQNFCM